MTTDGCAMQGYLQIPTSGTYVFTLTSTDGSRLLLSPSPGDELVLVDNDGALIAGLGATVATVSL